MSMAESSATWEDLRDSAGIVAIAGSAVAAGTSTTASF